MWKLAIALLALGTLVACNTVEGVAEDVKQTSKAVRRAI
nr:entericidin [uncultured Litoreibacter sp.]